MYVLYRIYHIFLIKTKLIKILFPVNHKKKQFVTLKKWRSHTPEFFFQGKNLQGFKKKPEKILSDIVSDIKKGNYIFFGKQKISLGPSPDWFRHPLTGFHYNAQKHWSEISDFSPKSGDIKYVWERARFSFLYDIIRYDYHFQKDESTFVFEQILDFIKKNPINKGPHYICSQEISLRVLNWIFALYYYKDSKNLTEEVFNIILNSIYLQLKHVYKNIHFSRLTVRNNHAITETLMLYLSGLLFPFFSESKKWKRRGKKWFEKEVVYQIYDDGSYIQHSFNYQRVLIQLLTWGIRLAELHKDNFSKTVYEKSDKTLQFLLSFLDETTGELPNYGSNDGALFFKLTNDDYANFRSQITDFYAVLKHKKINDSESLYWYGLGNLEKTTYQNNSKIYCYNQGGYYLFNEKNTKTFVRCAAYKDRPAQSDNLHLDIWINGKNILRDSGSYLYNTDEQTRNFFMGVEGHNTISINNKNQMLKANRFIWLNWIKKAEAKCEETSGQHIFSGWFEGFKELGKNIRHHRKIIKYKNTLKWEIKDTISGLENAEIRQYWQINPEFADKIQIKSFDYNNQPVNPVIEKGYYSKYYGIKEKSIRWTFITKTKEIKTIITFKP